MSRCLRALPFASSRHVKPNSKRPGTASGDRFAKYQSAHSASEYLKLGGTKSDLAHDPLKKGIVAVKVKVFDDVDVTPELGEASDSDDDDDGVSLCHHPRSSIADVWELSVLSRARAAATATASPRRQTTTTTRHSGRGRCRLCLPAPPRSDASDVKSQQAAVHCA